MRRVALTSLASILILIVACGCESLPFDDRSLSDPPVSELFTPERRERFEERQGKEVAYSNPSAGYTADYDLDLEYGIDGEVERINFPTGGYEDDFTDQHDNGDGTITVTDVGGPEVTVPMDDPDNDSVRTGDDEGDGDDPTGDGDSEE